MANERVFTKYLPATGHDCTHIKVELYYYLGGYNYFTYKEEKRGYYISVTPVSRSERQGYTMESVTMFRGVKQLIKEVARKSVKAATEATALAVEAEQRLIEYVCRNEGVEVIA